MKIALRNLKLSSGMTVTEMIEKEVEEKRNIDIFKLLNSEIEIPDTQETTPPLTADALFKKVYICSPLRGDIEKNKAAAKDYCRWAALEYYPLGNEKIMPIAPHVYLTEFLDDNISDQRELGLQMGLDLLRECSEIWVFGNTISEGMAMEIEAAAELGIKIRFNLPPAAVDTGGGENGEKI